MKRRYQKRIPESVSVFFEIVISMRLKTNFLSVYSENNHKDKARSEPLENNIAKGCCLKNSKEEKTQIIRQSNDIYEKHLLRE